MLIVKSIIELQQHIAEIRSLRLGFLTNFFLDSKKHSVWIKNGDCYAERVGNTFFIVKQSPTFWNVFYCSTTLEDYGRDLSAFMAEHSATTMMFDIVGRDMQCRPLVELFLEKGCKEATSLVRMTRTAEPFEYIPDSSIRKATETDIPRVSRLLHEYFNPQNEQIPYDEELVDYARQGAVLVCEVQKNIAGFLIYERNASTLYLRYWFTHPNYRDNKVGSRLLRRFFEDGKETRRQLFWVIRTNDNAIKRYRHYGFAEENMFDFVMQFN